MSKIVFWRWYSRRGPPTKISCLAFFLSIEAGLEESNQPPTQWSDANKCAVDKLSTHWRPRFPSLNPILVDDDVEDDDDDDDAMDGGIDRCTHKPVAVAIVVFVCRGPLGIKAAGKDGKDVGRAWAGTPRQRARVNIVMAEAKKRRTRYVNVLARRSHGRSRQKI